MAEIFANASNVNAVARNQYNMVNSPLPVGRDELLATLNPSNGRNSYIQSCMPGTRQSIFTEIEDWAARTNGEVSNILLLTGSPGAGKSAIASSLVSKWKREGKLSATFAFKHDNVGLSDPAAMWRSVAFDLAKFDPTLGDVVVRALNDKTVDPNNPNIRLHFENLIEPMTRIKNHEPIFIVLNALDECGREDSDSMKSQRRALLDTLVMFRDFPPSFKLVVTSRDERLSEAFRNVCHYMTLQTGDGVTDERSLDIGQFLKRHFSEIDGLKVDQEVFAKLTAQAAGLFIWAETVVKFLDQKGAFPAQLLKLIMDDKFVKDPVSNLYKDILEISFSNANDDILEAVKAVLGAIALAKVPLHYEDLEYLTEVELPSIENIMGRLSSVISHEEGDCLQISHFSFLNFLCDDTKCPEQFFISSNKHNLQFTKACLKVRKNSKLFPSSGTCNTL